MVVFDFTNLYPYVPQRNLWLDAAISATASHINTAINYLANNRTNKANKEINQQQIDYAREAFEKEKEYNNWLLGNQRQLQMSDSKQAGVNPAFAQGSSLGGASINPDMKVPQQIPMDYNFDTSGITNGVQNMLQYLLQKKSVDADVRQKNADAERQELLNDDKKAKNNILNQEYNEYWRTPDGQILTNDQADEWVKAHPTELPNFVREKDKRANVGAEGRFEGKKALREWDSRVKYLNEEDWRNALSEAVSKSQLSDSEVLDSIKNMPRKEFEQLTQIVQGLVNENSVWDSRKEMIQIELNMAKLQKEIAEDSNLYQYINKMFTGDFTWQDFGKLLAMTIVGLAQNIGGIGVGFTNLKSLGTSKPNKIGFR